MVAGIDDQALDLPNRAVRRVYLVAAAHLDLTYGHTVGDHRFGTNVRGADVHAADAQAHARTRTKPVVGQREHLLLLIVPLSGRSRQKPRLLSILERVELRHRAPQPDL